MLVTPHPSLSSGHRFYPEDDSNPPRDKYVLTMRPSGKRRPPTRSSKRICEEKLCCPFDNCEAKYFCEDCKSAQCQDCERSFHSTKLKYDFHARKHLPRIPETLLCEARKVNLVCQEKNFPDLWCENCKVQLCYTCFDIFHSSDRKRQHINISIAHHQKKLKEIQDKLVKSNKIELHDSSEFYEDAVGPVADSMIKPLAPYSSLGDDSLTFCSFPQEADETQNNMAFTSSITSDNSIPDLCQGTRQSNVLDRASLEDSFYQSPATNSFLLVNENEILQIENEDQFVEYLGCDRNDIFKVVSIFGNTGDGKSHTLNHTFFDGRQVFCTSPSQSSCTLGVWSALDLSKKVIIMDTEGLLGSSSNENERTRLLLKILAVSDIVIYRTRAERLHDDMFLFLSNASKAYCKHFTRELKVASQKYGIPMSNLGPTLVVFQETTHTEILKGNKDMSPAGILREMFEKRSRSIDAFRNICYVGVKTEKPPTDFSSLQNCINVQLKDNSVRAARKPEVIFKSLKTLNDKFSETIETLDTFPDQYFTCTSKCLACNVRCVLGMNHDADSQMHDAGRGHLCQYQSQYGNKVFMCKACLRNKKQMIVVPKTSSSTDSSWMGLTKYIWSGYVYECPNCGIIFRSREHWYGNEDEEKVLHVEFKHVWPQGPSVLDGTHNAARKVLESFHYVADTLSSVGAGPTKILSEWTADQINPSYWVPNAEIIKCSQCELLFTSSEQKHHCRACGKGFCTDCSTKRRPVPERGWGQEPVRVCDNCFDDKDKDVDDGAQETVTARKVGEAVSSTFSAVASALDYPLGMIKNSARPGYWVPDDQITACCVCENKFGPRLAIHHCRACGKGVCEECSPSKRVVAFRGWDYPVRVCNKCEKKTDRI